MATQGDGVGLRRGTRQVSYPLEVLEDQALEMAHEMYRKCAEDVSSFSLEELRVYARTLRKMQYEYLGLHLELHYRLDQI